MHEIAGKRRWSQPTFGEEPIVLHFFPQPPPTPEPARGRAAATMSMIAAADDYARLKALDPPEDVSMSYGHVTCCDPCMAPRKRAASKKQDQMLRPEELSDIMFPADERGTPLEMEQRDCTLPASSVPYLRKRFSSIPVNDLMKEHDGTEEEVDDAHGRAHIEHGWTKDNDVKFRENEQMLRAVFGSNWDARYGRTRVRCAKTGRCAMGRPHLHMPSHAHPRMCSTHRLVSVQ